MNAERAVFVYTTYEKKALKVIDLVQPWLLVVDMRLLSPFLGRSPPALHAEVGDPAALLRPAGVQPTRPFARRAWGDSVGCSNP